MSGSPERLMDRETIPADVRLKTDALTARVEGIRRTLSGRSYSTTQRQAAKDSLAVLQREIGELWSLL